MSLCIVIELFDFLLGLFNVIIWFVAQFIVKNGVDIKQ